MVQFGRQPAPLVHSSRHEDTGDDEISVDGLSGALEDAQPLSAHDLAGSDHNADTLADLNLKVSDATLDDSSATRTPSAHEATHESGGADPVDISSLAGTLDHGGLAGKDDDDHSLYHTDARGDARYVQFDSLLSNFALAYNYKAIIQGTYIFATDTGQCLNMFFYNSSDNVNDEIEYELFARDGARTFALFGMKGNNLGIVTIYLDDVSQGTIDLYNGAASRNQINTLAVTVVGTGMHSVKMKVTGKNGSSSGYFASATSLRIY